MYRHARHFRVDDAGQPPPTRPPYAPILDAADDARRRARFSLAMTPAPKQHHRRRARRATNIFRAPFSTSLPRDGDAPRRRRHLLDARVPAKSRREKPGIRAMRFSYKSIFKMTEFQQRRAAARLAPMAERLATSGACRMPRAFSLFSRKMLISQRLMPRL